MVVSKDKEVNVFDEWIDFAVLKDSFEDMGIRVNAVRISEWWFDKLALSRKEAVDDYKEGLREKICIKLCWYDWFTDQAQDEILKIIDK